MSTELLKKLCRMDPEEYHRDPCPVPALSSSIAHELLERSPLHAFTRHPRLGGIPRKATKEMNAGTLAHALLLDAGKERIEIIDAEDFRTKAARELRDIAIEAGKTPVLAHAYAGAEEIAETLKQRFADFGIVLGGESEMAAFWVETTPDGIAVQCRGQQDHIVELDGGLVVYDLKSSRSAHPVSCQRHIDSYDYAVQRAAYVSALSKLRPEFAGRIDFVFVFFELEPPFAVTPTRINGEFRSLGECRWNRAVDLWGRCLRENRWPGYTTRILELEPPKWALERDIDQAMATAMRSEDDGTEAAE